MIAHSSLTRVVVAFFLLPSSPADEDGRELEEEGAFLEDDAERTEPPNFDAMENKSRLSRF